MTPWNGNDSRITVTLWGESMGDFSSQRASNAELWFFYVNQNISWTDGWVTGDLRSHSMTPLLYLCVKCCRRDTFSNGLHDLPIFPHWGRDKMADILRTTLSSAFSWNKMSENFTELCSQESNWQYSSIVSDNGLAPRVQLTIFQHCFR